jgi:sporulation protein YlmC with PRC-barrel domain
MTINTKEMHGVPVLTEQGISVGRVASFDLEADTGRMKALRVKLPGILTGLLSDELHVPWASIVELGKDRVIITDASIPAEARTVAKRMAANPEPLMKESET